MIYQGGVVGVTIAGSGWHCLNWTFSGLGGIVASWVISPLLSGIIGAITFYLTDTVILGAVDPRQAAAFAMPILYSTVTFVYSETNDSHTWVHLIVQFA